MHFFKKISKCLAYASVSAGLSSAATAVAQTVTPAIPTGPLPTDLTPIRLKEEQQIFSPGASFYLNQKLPASLWFNMSTEVNQRFESNIFLAAKDPVRSYVFRAFPNVTVGYNFWKNTGIYTNYFLIKDVYTASVRLTHPTNQSLSIGLRHSRAWGKTNLQFDVQARELWQAKLLHQFDYLPGMTITRPFGTRNVVYMNVVLQMRGGEPFVAPTREIDPFYTLGYLRNFGRWNFNGTVTYITNFRHPVFPFSIPNQGNEEIICDFEVNHPISKKIPNVVAFLRAEPIWNWDSKREVGLSGFDFRLYSGIRIQPYKQPVNSLINQMRNELQLPKQGSKKRQPPATGPGPAPSNTPTTTDPGSTSFNAHPPLPPSTNVDGSLTAASKSQGNSPATNGSDTLGHNAQERSGLEESERGRLVSQSQQSGVYRDPDTGLNTNAAQAVLQTMPLSPLFRPF